MLRPDDVPLASAHPKAIRGLEHLLSNLDTCSVIRAPLTKCVPLPSPGTGSLSLVGAFERLAKRENVTPAFPTSHSASNYHSIRVAFSHRDNYFNPTAGWSIRAPCYILPVREPVERLRSGFNLHHEQSQVRLIENGAVCKHETPQWPDAVIFGGVCVRSLSAWLQLMRNASAPAHAKAARVFNESVSSPRWTASRRNVAETQNVFLVPQVDYLKGLNCTRHSIHMLRTRHLFEDFRALLRRADPQLHAADADADAVATALMPVAHNRSQETSSFRSLAHTFCDRQAGAMKWLEHGHGFHKCMEHWMAAERAPRL